LKLEFLKFKVKIIEYNPSIHFFNKLILSLIEVKFFKLYTFKNFNLSLNCANFLIEFITYLYKKLVMNDLKNNNLETFRSEVKKFITNTCQHSI
jgi:hypothetical protein